tara:strand:+ start:688 stop:1002 length:315 start_codon:yes stop_codon:yes gene_type:complete
MAEITKSGSGGWGSQGGKSSMGMIMPNRLPQFKMGDTPSKSMKKRFGDSRVGKSLSSLRSSFGKKKEGRVSLLGGRRRRKKSGKKKRTKRRTKKARRTRRTRRR